MWCCEMSMKSYMINSYTKDEIDANIKKKLKKQKTKLKQTKKKKIKE